MDKLYIHYGHRNFSKERVTKMRNGLGGNIATNKPDFGLWGSPVDCDFGWKDWCESEDFRTDTLDRYFVFKAKDGAKIFTVRKNNDVSDYICLDVFKHIDFNKIMKEYDGMELIHCYNYMDLHYGYFYSWDVDSIVVWNPDVIEVVRKYPQKLHVLR